MEQNKGSVRTTLSLMASVCLHSLAIVLIALGPTFFLGLSGQGDKESQTLEFSVAGSNDHRTAAVEQVVSAPAELPAPAQVADVITPVAKPVAKPKAVKKVATAPAVEEVPVVEKTIEEQPIIAAANTESPIEDAAATESEEVLATEETTDEQKEEIKVEDIAVTAEETPVAAQEVAANGGDAATTQAAAGTGADAVKSDSNGEGHEVIEVTQNYTGLNQQSGNKPPQYTREMRLQQLQGRGQLVYFVNKDGSVKDVKLAKSTGSKVLDQAAIDAFSKYKFVPGQEGYTLHDFEFSLKGPAESERARLRTTYNR